MENIKSNIAKNISELRQKNGLTQAELAEKLNYSDKAVSKWERAESTPDITVLAEIAELFEVPLDYLIKSEHEQESVRNSQNRWLKAHNYAIITGMSILLVWLIATFLFVVITLASKKGTVHWLSFVYAVPVSMIVWLVMNSIWFNRKRNYLIVSLLMWSILISVYVTVLTMGFNIWLIFVLGIPGQIIIALWSKIKYPKS